MVDALVICADVAYIFCENVFKNLSVDFLDRLQQSHDYNYFIVDYTEEPIFSLYYDQMKVMLIRLAKDYSLEVPCH